MASEIYAEGKTSVIKQYIAALSANILSLCYGCALGWTSPSLPILTGTNTPLDAPLTQTQASLVASLICIGGLIGTPIFGFISDKYGRKKALIFSTVPVLIGWGVKIVSATVEGLYMSRILAGFGGAAVFLVVPNYCVEIASLSTRGILGSLVIFGMNSGIVIMYIMGAYLNYRTVLFITFCLPVLAFILIILAPETPVYLVKQNKYEKAAKAIAWLRREREDSPVVIKVLEMLKHENNLSSDFNNRHSNNTSDVSPWKFFLTSTPTKNAFAVCFGLVTVQSLIGLFAVITFSNSIFKETGSDLPPSVNSIIVGILQLLGSIIASSLIERTGRRILLITSCAIISIGMMVIGFYFYAIEYGYNISNLGWMPVTALSFVVCTYSMGIGPVPFMLPSEIIMVKGRGIAATFMNMWVWTLSFFVAQIFNTLVNSLGTYVVFWIFSAFACLGIVITVLFLPETKGKSFESILTFYSGKRKTNILVMDE